jgi:hypothetical protein
VPHIKSQIDSRIKSFLAQTERVEKAGLKTFLKSVDELRQAVVLNVVEQGEITPATASALKQRIAQTIQYMEPRLNQELSANQHRLFVKGIQLIDEVLETADIRTGLPYLSEQTLEQARAFGADLVTGLTDYTRKRIADQINLAVLGQKPVSDVVKEIGRNLKSPSVFGTVTKRATVIYRTEMSRIQNMAATQRLKQTGKQVQDLKKEWLHSHVGIPRPGHSALDGVVVNVSEKFELVGVDGKLYRVDGPLDPILPLEDSIQCRCRIAPLVGRFMKEQATQ